ncbi:MAG: response regulator [Micavibrio sp.]|nr:response regulator [Micavibrio sp.]
MNTSIKNIADILIIDDSDTDTLLMEEALKDTATTSNIHIFNNCKSGMEFLNKSAPHEDAPRPDLVVLDLNMPGFDGLEFLRFIKRDPSYSYIPVVVLTTSSDDNDIEKCYRSMANCYIVKPVNFQTFKKTISVISDFWLGVVRLPPKGID